MYGHRIAKASPRVRMGVKDQFNGYFKGKIAEMKVYELALNKVKIQTSIPLIDETPVVGYFRKR